MATPKRLSVFAGSLVAVAALAAGIGWYLLRPQPRPDIHKVGGTVLVYQIDTSRRDTGAVAELLAEALQRRLDADGLAHVTVRPLGKDKVEVQIPMFGDDHRRDVAAVKALTAQAGVLEFKILANGHDDKMAVSDAAAQIANPANRQKLEEAAVAGAPPPGPLRAGSDIEPKKYAIDLPGNQKSMVTYSWVEVGPQERQNLGLDNAARTDTGNRKKTWDYVHARLGQAIQIPLSAERYSLLHGALFYSRGVKDKDMPKDEKEKKQYEYFVLARNPEIDMVTGKETPKMDGSYLQSASAVNMNTPGERPAVAFVFNAKGGELFGTLTEKNLPGLGGERQVKRHLAIILDGLVMSAPTINSRITSRGQITGRFTREEVEHMVAILRAGALPATLRPRPIQETTIPASKD
jgi:SecD/SecF fusion protein